MSIGTGTGLGLGLGDTTTVGGRHTANDNSHCEEKSTTKNRETQIGRDHRAVDTIVIVVNSATVNTNSNNNNNCNKRDNGTDSHSTCEKIQKKGNAEAATQKDTASTTRPDASDATIATNGISESHVVLAPIVVFVATGGNIGNIGDSGDVFVTVLAVVMFFSSLLFRIAAAAAVVVVVIDIVWPIFNKPTRSGPVGTAASTTTHGIGSGGRPCTAATGPGPAPAPAPAPGHDDDQHEIISTSTPTPTPDANANASADADADARVHTIRSRTRQAAQEQQDHMVNHGRRRRCSSQDP